MLLLGMLVYNTLDRIGGGSLNLPPPAWLVDLVTPPPPSQAPQPLPLPRPAPPANE